MQDGSASYGTAQFVINGANFLGRVEAYTAALEEAGSEPARETQELTADERSKNTADTASVISLMLRNLVLVQFTVSHHLELRLLHLG